MQSLSFKLELFEGPLELMLHLVSKHKLNINDISIQDLLVQYMAYIEDMQSADLEVTSEFLAMAARLVYIKTVSLLPRSEEALELKKELEGQLLEYHLAKIIAGQMKEIYKGGLIFVRKQQRFAVDKTYTCVHEISELQKAYALSLGKGKRRLPPSRAAFTDIISKRMVSVESRIVFLLKKLYSEGRVLYSEFFYSSERSELVATFLAMLELIKSNRIVIDEQNNYISFSNERRLSSEEIETIGNGSHENSEVKYEY